MKPMFLVYFLRIDSDWRLEGDVTITLCKQRSSTKEDQTDQKYFQSPNKGISSFLRIQSENEDHKFDSKFMH